jgi:hypothetical protein
MTLTKMDKLAAKALGDATQKALEAVAREFGVTVKAGGGKYDPAAGTFAPRVEFTLASQDGAPVGKDAAAFRQYAEVGLIEGGFTPEHLGATFTHRGEVHKVVGYRPRKRQSLIVERGGKLYCFEPVPVARLLGLEAKPFASRLTLTDAPGGK